MICAVVFKFSNDRHGSERGGRDATVTEWARRVTRCSPQVFLALYRRPYFFK